jgi:muconolactone delta-isomerase
VTPSNRSPPEDPRPNARASEFFTAFTLAVPAEASPDTDDAATQREADRVRELAGQGYLERLWTLPGQGRSLGLWQAPDSAALNAMLASLPLSPSMRVQTTPLTRHPSDPAITSG